MDWSLYAGLSIIVLGAISGAISLWASRADKKNSDLQIQGLSDSLFAMSNQNRTLTSEVEKSNLELQTLNSKLDPFIEFAKSKYPDKTTEEGLNALQKDINKLRTDVDETKAKTIPKISNFKQLYKNKIVTECRDANKQNVIEAKSFGVDQLYESSLELLYSTELQRNEILWCITKNDIVAGTVKFSEAGLFSYERHKMEDNGDCGFLIHKPGNGIYTFTIYSLTPITKNVEINWFSANRKL